MFNSVLDPSSLGIVVLSILGIALGLFLLLKRPAAKGRAPSFFTRAVLRVRAAVGSARWQGAVLLIGSPLALCWWAGQSMPLPDDIPQTGIVPLLETAMQKELQVRASTDRGRIVQLYRFAEYAEPAAAAALRESEPMALRHWEPYFRLIRRNEADPHANCHGWTFAGGRHWIKSESVQAILDDNGYQLVDTPRADDLVVYHNAGDTITHSGVVRVSGPDGLVLIESKWSWQGTFLHAPEDQPYGSLYTYYRSERVGHCLRGLDGETPDRGGKARLFAE